MTSTGYFAQKQLQVIDTAVTRVVHLESQRRRLEAEQLSDLAVALQAAVGDGARGNSDRELAYRSLRLEVATATHQSEYRAERLLSTAYAAQEHYPTTLEALRGGEISLDHLRVVTDEGAPIETGDEQRDAPRRAAYEREVLEVAREETPNRLRPIARRLAATHSGASLAERHAEALKRRCVRVVPLDDGMADLIAHLPAEDAYAIRDRITQLAKKAAAAQAAEGAKAANSVNSAQTVGEAGRQSLNQAGAVTPPRDSTSQVPIKVPTDLEGPVQVRSTEEVRADVFRDLLLNSRTENGEGSEAVQAHIQIVIPEHGVPELIGFGPIDDVTASRLAASAEAWERIQVDAGGGVIAVDRYRPTPRMSRLLAARDLHCRAPGCRVPVSRCDNDHTVDAALGGPTATDNLAHLCRGHHTLKHHTDWEVTQLADGVLKWRSPTGREHLDRPPSRVRFRQTHRTGEADTASPL